MKIKVSEATRLQLDWLVAKCEHAAILTCATGEPTTADEFADLHDNGWSNYSADWLEGGPIIEREGIEIHPHGLPLSGWVARVANGFAHGSTPLIAAMRRYVTSKLGDEVEVPEELA